MHHDLPTSAAAARPVRSGPAVPVRLSRTGTVALVLALTCTACTDRDVEDPGPVGTEVAAASPVGISITDYEIVMPTSLPAGPARLTINNTGTESCTFTMAPQSAGRMTSNQGPSAPAAPSGAGPEQDGERRTVPGATDPATTPGTASGSGPTGTPSGSADTDTAGRALQGGAAADLPGSADRDAAQGLTHTVVAAGQNAVIATDLRPGAYQVWCSETSEAGRRPRAMAQQVMVTAAEAEAAEGDPSRRRP